MARIVEIKSVEEKQEIINYLRQGRYPLSISSTQKRSFRKKALLFKIVNDLLCYKNSNGTFKRAVFEFEREVIQMILSEEHLPAHPGINKMVDIIHKKYYGIPSGLIKEYVKSCETCARYNSLNTIEDIQVNEITQKFDRYMMDCVDLRRYADHNDGYSWILNVMDTYTKYLWSFKMTNKNAQLIKECLEFIYMNFGVPISIQADNGKEFSNRLLNEFHRNFNIRVIHGRPRNPRAQGQIERLNQTIKKWLSKALSNTQEKRWIDVLSTVVHKYNLTRHRATNQSPFLLFHGQSGFNTPVPDLEITEDEEDIEDREYETWVLDEDILVLPSQEVHEQVMSHFSTYRETTIANANPNTVERRLEIGDRVLLRLDFDNNTNSRRNALDGFFDDATFIIISILQNNMLKIKNENTGEIINVFKRRLRKL
ncbi:Transposon Tf2-6 polyprotein [Dictyocoela muelleri]|nr:Transposon Tf2-6 polyprotein [Dictyocoela muelleri]